MNFHRAQKGFTLLELLVVIAIIGVLSTIVITSISAGRVKARNSYISSSMLQYVNAFSMYYSTNGSYPTPDTAPGTATKCLGHRTSECGLLVYVDGVLDISSQTGQQNPGLDAEIETVYSAAPPFENIHYLSPGSSEIHFAGPLYSCNLTVGGRCVSVNINWYLFGNDQKCVRNGTPLNAGTATSCTITLN